MALLDIIPYDTRFVSNDSGRFESRYGMVTVEKSNSIMLKSLQGTTFGIWSAHGEGKFTSPSIEQAIIDGSFKQHEHSFPIRYVDYKGNITETYPNNPNGSPQGITAIVSDNGRHLAMMPHPERSYLSWQLAYCPEFIKKKLKNLSPWFLMFQDAYDWCQQKQNEESVNYENKLFDCETELTNNNTVNNIDDINYENEFEDYEGYSMFT